MRSPKPLVAAAALLMVGAAAFFALDRTYHFTGGHGEVVDGLIARNVAARGGAEAWRAVSSLRLSGRMDLGQEMHVPYVMEQKRPDKMCLEFEFDEEWATQCVDGDSGWKLLPYRGKRAVEPMNDEEYREMAASVPLDGLLFDSDERGYRVRLLGTEAVDGRNASKLEVTLPDGAVRWVYLDDETGLEVKLEATRTLRGKERRVATFFSDWEETDGLLIAHRQETRTEGETETHFLTVESVVVNPELDDSSFEEPADSVAATPRTARAAL